MNDPEGHHASCQVTRASGSPARSLLTLGGVSEVGMGAQDHLPCPPRLIQELASHVIIIIS